MTIEWPYHPPQVHPREVYMPREVSRLVRPEHHREGFHGLNAIGDIQDMMSLGYGLREQDKRFMKHVLACCIREADTPDGLMVSMSDRQWRMFLIIRRYFLSNPEFARYQLQSRLHDAEAIFTEL